ncbi:MAG TPA: hypothetical protein VJM51_07900 [Dehalococcoidia bacterium]|nr:hypothetical protein [Dehalococcoidia bacterium]
MSGRSGSSERRQWKNESKGSSFRLSLPWVVAILATFGATAFLGFAVVQSANPEASNPSGGEFIPLGALAVSAQNVDLGRVPLNKEVTQIFRVRNISQEPVRLGKVMVNVLEGC